MFGQFGQRYCVVVSHNRDEQTKSMARKSYAMANACKRCNSHSYRQHGRGMALQRTCQQCSFRWSRELRPEFTNSQRKITCCPHCDLPVTPEQLVSRKSVVEQKPVVKGPRCAACGTKQVAVVGDGAKCLLSTCGALSSLVSGQVIPDVYLGPDEDIKVEEIAVCPPPPPFATPSMVVKADVHQPPAKRVSFAEALKRPHDALVQRVVDKGPSLKLVAPSPPKMPAAFRVMQPPKNPYKLVNQSLTTTFDGLEPCDQRDRVAPTANKRIARAIVQDLVGEEDVLRGRKILATHTDVEPKKEDFQFVRQLRLPRYVHASQQGNVGVWVVVPDPQKEQKLEYVDLWLIALTSIGKEKEMPRLMTALAKIRWNRQKKRAIRRMK